MTKKMKDTSLLKRLSTGVFVALALMVGTLYVQPVSPAAALTDNQQAVCDAIGSTDCQTDPTGAKNPDTLIKKGIDVFSAIIGVVAVVMIMVGGFKYITSAGDSSKVSSAKSTIIYAIIGLIIVVLSQTIVKFVISKLI